MSAVEKLCVVKNDNHQCIAGVFHDRPRADEFAQQLEKTWKQKYVVNEITRAEAGKAWSVFLRMAI